MNIKCFYCHQNYKAADLRSYGVNIICFECGNKYLPFFISWKKLSKLKIKKDLSKLKKEICNDK